LFMSQQLQIWWYHKCLWLCLHRQNLYFGNKFSFKRMMITTIKIICNIFATGSNKNLTWPEFNLMSSIHKAYEPNWISVLEISSHQLIRHWEHKICIAVAVSVSWDVPKLIPSHSLASFLPLSQCSTEKQDYGTTTVWNG
jgi:hypothetical protein